jgi:hypothetical protein
MFFYTSLFTYGAAALEIVLTPSRESIADIVPMDVWTVRFRREGGKLQAYQIHEGELIKLPMEWFIYVGMDKDGTNPYGRSMLRPVPFLVKIQERLIEDMAKATHNAGWPELHVSYSPSEPSRARVWRIFRKFCRTGSGFRVRIGRRRREMSRCLGIGCRILGDLAGRVFHLLLAGNCLSI